MSAKHLKNTGISLVVLAVGMECLSIIHYRGLMGFNGGLMGFNGGLMGFNGL